MNRIKTLIVKLPLVKYIIPFVKKLLFKKHIKYSTPVFIYQMGKVASSSVHYSIKNYYNRICIHAHTFTPSHNDIQVKELYKHYKNNKVSIKIITLIREPIAKNNVELLVMKHDLNNTIKENIISKFINLKTFKITNSNEGNNKEYFKEYSDFKKISLPTSYLNYMLNSKYSKHFYKDQIEILRLKYS
ncbi:MAG: hypothetical protein H6615_11275 [Ignavibacteria bacterium]|nr:hypothetical protein [Ignavibacteria bacterium]